jgi:hypothetical protein
MKNKSALILPTAIALAMSAGYGIRVYAENVPATTPLFYAGTLEEAGQLVDGMRTVTLTVWDKESEGKQVCQSITENLSVSAGHFRMAVSDACASELRAANKPADVWIALSFKDGSGTPHDIPGRTKVGAVPFALRAESAASATGALAGQVVPVGMISMFAGACPGGWTEYMPLRGRVPRGEPMGNTAALDNGGSDDAVVVNHTHGGTTALSEHTHNGTTSGESQSHAHGGVTDNNFAWPNCDIFDGSGGPGEVFQPAVYSTRFVGGNCTYRDRTAHGHAFTTGNANQTHTHTFAATGGSHSHAFTTADATGAVAKAGQNMQAFREVIFCIKQ